MNTSFSRKRQTKLKGKASSFKANMSALKSRLMSNRKISREDENIKNKNVLPVPHSQLKSSMSCTNNLKDIYNDFELFSPKNPSHQHEISFYDSDDIIDIDKITMNHSQKKLNKSSSVISTTNLINNINKPMQSLMDSTPEDIYWSATGEIIGFSFEKRNPQRTKKHGNYAINDGSMTDRGVYPSLTQKNKEIYSSSIDDDINVVTNVFSTLYKHTASSQAKSSQMKRCESEPRRPWKNRITRPIDPPLECAKRAERWNNVLLPAKVNKQKAIEQMEVRRKKLEEERNAKLMKIVRASLVHVPLEMPDFSNVFKPDLSRSKPATRPCSPNFSLKSRTNRMYLI